MTRINVPDHVENEQAYIRAAEARIKMNALTGKRDRWLKASPTAQRCIDFLTGSGEFEGPINVARTEEYNAECRDPHPLIKAAWGGEFYGKMLDTLHEWGALSEKQEAAVLGMIEKAQARIQERADARRAEQAGSEHVGTIGERRDFTLTMTFATMFEGSFGYVHITGFKDEAGNVFIYKGSKKTPAERGETLTFKATIKDHGERDGVKQTMLTRPKF